MANGDDGVSNFLHRYWQLGVGLVAVGITYGAMQVQVDANKTQLEARAVRIGKLELGAKVAEVEREALVLRVATLEKEKDRITKLEQSSAVIQAQYVEILRRLDRLTAKLDGLRKGP